MQNPDEYRLYWTGLTDYDGERGHKLILQHRENPDMPYVDIKTVSFIDEWDWGKALRQQTREINGINKAYSMPKMSENEYAEPDPSGWFVQYHTEHAQVFKHNAKYHCCVDLVNANPNQIKPDDTLNQYEYRYISPDKRHSVLVTFEDKDTLFGPYINENSEVDYSISYKQALELFASCGITLDTPEQIEQAMFNDCYIGSKAIPIIDLADMNIYEKGIADSTPAEHEYIPANSDDIFGYSSIDKRSVLMLPLIYRGMEHLQDAGIIK